MPTLSHDRQALPTLWLALAATVSLAGGCVDSRDPALGEGVHPLGWADSESPRFHAKVLRENGDDLTDCRQCHGDDYRGGPVGVSCMASGCHENEGGPENCDTCHGDGEAPFDGRPTTGAHEKHGRFCAECHVVPEHASDEGHIGDDHAGPDLTFSGLATADGATPTYNPEEPKTCSGVYCHVDGTPEWNQEGPLECDACHQAPPGSHERFAAVAQPPDDCATCHPDPADPEGTTHVDGSVELELPEGCGTCHGHDDSGAPPEALSRDPFDPAIGAHARHLDRAAADRVAEPVACESCHVVPTEDDVLADGHIDAESPADVVLVGGGTYDPDDKSCVVWCHDNRDPGPAFGDESIEGPSCDACHDSPPANHERFGRIANNPNNCGTCHPTAPAATHVNHELDLALPAGCGTCHGLNDEGYPPLDLAGRSDTALRTVGAHVSHMAPVIVGRDRISAPVACSSCHVVPDDVFADGHLDAAPADVVLIDGGSYNVGTGSCRVSCHWDNNPGPFWTIVDGTYAQCGTCHTMPPATVRESGIAHPASGPDLADCVVCHFNYSVETHVNGEVDF